MDRLQFAEEDVMKKLVVALAMWFAVGAGCAVDAEDLEGPEPPSAPSVPGAPSAPDGATEHLLVPAIPAGCAAPVTCAGAKTCGAWSEFTQCAPQFSACDNTCVEAPPAYGVLGGVTAMGRAGCQAIGTFLPQNRTRACVIRATGQTCIETGYSARKLQCSPAEG